MAEQKLVLFEITEEQLETGLRGVPVGYCSTSTVDPQKGLHYSGIPVSQMVHWSPEQVLYLLTNGREGSKAEVEGYYHQLVERQGLSPRLHEAILRLPRDLHPMNLLSMALLLASSYEATGNWQEDALRLIAKIPAIGALVIRHHAGWQAPLHSSATGYMEQFIELLGCPTGDRAMLTRVLRLFNILHYDHGGGNLSTFIGKAVASGLADLYQSLSAAMCALAGPRHGKANQDALQFVEELLASVGPQPRDEQLQAALQEHIAGGGLLYGFGHAVLRVEDPRATTLYGVAEELFPGSPLVQLALRLRRAGSVVLQQQSKVSNPYPNVDAISGVLLSAAGFHYPEYFTVLFGIARVVGIAIQIVDERCYARQGKGTPIVRPKYIYRPRIR